LTPYEGRSDRLAELVAERELDALLITHMLSVRYLTGFRGTNAVCVLTPERRTFFTDFRYTERAEAEVEGWERADAARELVPEAAKLLNGKSGFDDVHMSVSEHCKLIETVEDRAELVAAGGLVEKLRRTKDEGELSAIAEAAKLADDVYRHTLERGLAGRTEKEVASVAVAGIRELGAEPSFPPIVAAGPNAALPHADPGDRPIGPNELIVFDMGAELDSYCSDCTRTFATGDPGGEATAVYEATLRAQLAGLDAVRPGIAGTDADAAARAVIEEAGHGERFGHGLGHGVGLEVHEAPRLSTVSDDVLGEGEVVTVEPGIYLPGRFGVRIEDLVVVSADGTRILTGLPKELTVVD